jgi:hypothetical protein
MESVRTSDSDTLLSDLIMPVLVARASNLSLRDGMLLLPLTLSLFRTQVFDCNHLFSCLVLLMGLSPLSTRLSICRVNNSIFVATNIRVGTPGAQQCARRHRRFARHVCRHFRRTKQVRIFPYIDTMHQLSWILTLDQIPNPENVCYCRYLLAMLSHSAPYYFIGRFPQLQRRAVSASRAVGAAPSRRTRRV